MTDHTSKVLIVDSDDELLHRLEIHLKDQGFAVITSSEGWQGLRHLYREHPDVAIVAVELQGIGGWEVCQHIRAVSDVPIILLTSLGRATACVRALRMGADDCVIKPFDFDELSERVKALLRRARGAQEQRGADCSYADDYLLIDDDQGAVWCNGVRVSMTATEWKVLQYFVRNRGRLLTHRQILLHVWGPECVDQMDYVRLYIWRLRQKIEPDPQSPSYILTEHGLGYRFAPSV